MKTKPSPARPALRRRAALAALLVVGVLVPVASPASAAVATRTISVSKSGTGTGAVAATSATRSYSCGTTCTTTQSWSFPQNEVVTFTATPTASSDFGDWSGACTGKTCSFKVSGNASVAASFTIKQLALSVSRTGTGSGTVASTSSPSQASQVACGTSCSATYPYGATVTLTATSAIGSVFDGWGGACSGTAACVVTMTAAQSVSAAFTAIAALDVTWFGGGAGTVTSDPAGIACSAATTCTSTFARGTLVTLQAAASAGSVFLGWAGACDGAGACSVTLDGSTEVEAIFAPAYTLAVVIRGDGSGSISSLDGRIDCGSSCTALYEPTTCEGCATGTEATVELVADSAIGSVFTGWSGGGCSGTGPCVVAITDAVRVDAAFAVASYPVSVSLDGAGSGTITSIGGAISCPGTCTADVPHGETLTLVANPDAVSAFSAWTGEGCATSGATCAVTITGPSSFTATFLPTEPLTLLRSGNGSGTVTSSPAGISCGSTCAARFVRGTSVSLEAAPAVGSVFAGWSGACTGTDPCTVTLDAAASVEATFTLERHEVAVTDDGPGVVASTPAGIDCGLDCSETWDHGTAVTLLATPDASSLFVGWSGVTCASGVQTAASCSFTVVGPLAVTATFVPAFTVTVATAGNGTGSVSSNPLGIACGATCSALFPAGSTVVLTGTPGTGSNFTAWSGDCSGDGPCSLVVDGPRSVTATFTLQVFSVAITIDGTGTGSVVATPGGTCLASCTLTFDYGTAVSLSPEPASFPLSTFVAWSGSGSGNCKTRSACAFTVTADRALTATFTKITVTLSITRNVYAGGDGTISVVGTALSCGTGCTSAQWPFDGNAGVTLQATPAADGVSAFTSWSGVVCLEGTQRGATCSFQMSVSRDITAGFGTPQTIAVSTTGTGGGWVTGPGIDCPTDCSETLVAGLNVALYADPGPLSSFGGWSDPACGTSSTCVLRLTAPTSITARFDPMLVQVTLGKGSADSGTGTVTSSPAGINCATTCSTQTASLPLGTVVTLTATPAADSYFAGWSGPCTGTGTCVVTVDRSLTVTATFGRPVLRLTKAGNGTGTVATSPTGFKCGSSCLSAQALYAPGTLVTLTATPSNGSGLAAWSGDCTGVALTCTVRMDRVRTVTATFGKLVTVSVSYSGSGSVASLAPTTRIACGSTCSASFAVGSLVTMRATPATGQVFSSWTSGPCTGSTDATCTFTLAGATSLRAAFVAG
ncbi:MAG: InlB B-repeat-containing protein [Actinomycetota bacterium]